VKEFRKGKASSEEIMEYALGLHAGAPDDKATESPGDAK
jgi:hypothetical protein